MKKISPLLKKYLPDILILSGVLIFSYNLLRPVTFVCAGASRFCLDGSGVENHHVNLQVLGIMLIVGGVILAVRRYQSSKNK